jgi:Rieske Fe-S protein
MTDSVIKSGQLSVERREFLKKTGSLAVMSMMGIAFFTSCTSEDDATPTPNNPPAGGSSGITIAGNSITINLNQATALSAAGGWLLITEAQLLVVNLGSNNYNALTSICTHSQCDRNWSFASSVFTCSCHGSRFNTDGTVVTGPAASPLRNFPTSRSGEILTITKS